MTPADELAAALQAARPELNVYPSPQASIVAPAVLIRPSDPWIEPDRFGADQHRYRAILVAPAADPRSATDKIHDLAHLVIATVQTVPGWAFERVGQILIDESTTAPYLVAPVDLTWRGDCTMEG